MCHHSIPAISVIVPVKNCSSYFRQCLDSILEQTLKNIEVIIINDGSSDDSGDIANTYALKDNRIIVIHNKVGVGRSSARNDGMSRARGKYIAFIDSDDFYSNANVLEKLYVLAIKKNLNICGGSLIYIDENNQKISRKNKDQIFTDEGIVYYKDYQYDGGFYRFIYKSTFLQKHNLHFIPNAAIEDCIFFVNAMHESVFFYCIPDIVYTYRKIYKNKESDPDFLYRKIKARCAIIKFCISKNYKKLYKVHMKGVLKDLKYIKKKHIYFFIRKALFLC